MSTERQLCLLDDELLAQFYKPHTSQWILNDTKISLLRNDLQELIFCTRRYDKLIFRLSEPIKLSKTMRIVHDLEFIGESNNTVGGEQARVFGASFTCPESGPALEVK